MSASLGKAIGRLLRDGADLAPLAPFRLGVLADATVDLLAGAMPAAAARHGVALDLAVAPYGQIAQAALDPGSDTNQAGCNAVLVAADQRWLKLDRPVAAEQATAAVDRAAAELRTVVEALRSHGGAPAILQTVPAPASALFGNFDRRVAGSPRALAETLNARIVALAEDTGSYILDMAALAERIGTDRWFDPTQWNAYKLPYAAAFNEIVADTLGRLLGAIRGKARKCLVLDLDNTVWGGVIGDDGLAGIRVGQGSARGEAFLAVQQLAIDLRDRGIILAVSSKNNDDTARLPFRQHPDMLLREEHVAFFQANWIDKPTNLEAIAAGLDIGLDALVLLDDNPAERAQVRAALPQVAVPELPEEPDWYPWYLTSAGYFEAVSFLAEDRMRAASYAANARRAEVMARSRDLGDYLSSLVMVIGFAPFDAQGRQRITQLVNKSNQFNLTTRRYTEAEIAALEGDPDAFTLQVRLADRLGNLGMVGVIIARPAGAATAIPAPAYEIDTWLMSCRVLGRRVEEAMLGEVVRVLAARGVERLVGRYRPTAKNGMVADHYPKLGFTTAGSEGADSLFELVIADHEAGGSLPFRIERAIEAAPHPEPETLVAMSA